MGNIIGRRFGRLVVIKQAKGFRSPTFICKCDCGNNSRTRASRLIRSETVSCGCFGRERSVVAHTKHGLAGKCSEYVVWAMMKQRCFNPRSFGFKNYGGRGITVCNRWKNNFHLFLKDLGERPSPSHVLERRNNNGNYEPGNCIWATSKEQSRNRRNNVVLSFRGQKKCIMDWCDELGLKFGLVWSRLHAGWTVEKSLTHPVYNKSNRKGVGGRPKKR